MTSRTPRPPTGKSNAYLQTVTADLSTGRPLSARTPVLVSVNSARARPSSVFQPFQIF